MPEKRLTVGELIQQLQQYNPDLPVRFEDGEWGWQDVTHARVETRDRRLPEGKAVAPQETFVHLEGVQVG